MKILQIIPHLNLGGAEAMCKHLSVELKKAGHDVIVVSLYNCKTQNTIDLEKAGITLRFLEKKLGFDFLSITKLNKFINEFKPDIIHTHLSSIKYAYCATLTKKIPIIHTIHSVAQKECGKFSKVLNKMFLKSGRVTFVGLSNQIGTTIHEVYRISKANIPIVFNGIPLDSCSAKNDYLLQSPISIAHVASFQTLKNHIEGIRAVKILMDRGLSIKLNLFGDGAERPQIEKFIIENNLEKSVYLNGLTNNVPFHLSNSDIFILPSLYEGIPLSIIEAMATGLPIVASNVGGIPDMISSGENGLLCEPTAESIAEKLYMLISDDELRKKCGTEAVESAKKFSSEQMMEKYMQIYIGVSK